MRCVIHNRETVKNCMWCGDKICTMCIKESNGKPYCNNCRQKLQGYKV
ncbi:MAG: hypothetical protein PHT54_04045 [Candidatus Nanoarchaeia archaeon]|nr:hypothetical protein [Candidatus Nanoarchaeia archaeon]